MKLSLWVRVLGLLAVAWFLLHGPQIPGPRPAPSSDIVDTVLGVVLASGVLVVLAYVGFALTPELPRPRWWSSELRARTVLAAVASTIGLAWLLDAGVRLLEWAEGSSLLQLDELFASLDPLERLGTAVVIGALPGISEELCFRGFVLGRLAAASRPGIAVVISAAVFGLFHFDPLHAAVACALGLVLGRVVVRCGALGPAMIAHAVSNAVAVATAGARSAPGVLVVSAALGLAMMLWGLLALERRPH